MDQDQPRLIATLLDKKPASGANWSALIALLICIFLSSYRWSLPAHAGLFSVSGAQFYGEHQFWRMFTATFVHSDAKHLFSNLYMLGVLSFLVVGYYGSRVFWLWSLVFASITNAIVVAVYDPQISLLGASGWVYFLAGFWLSMYMFIQRQKSISARILRVIGIGLVILFPSTFEPQVSYLAHAVAAAFGAAFATIYFFANKASLRSFEKFELSLSPIQ